ncbi:hypothetical protein [Candidatus Marithrix sp. Canyon 246]|uniref:hypothetical protein n=1 Tax=Candidatus Marithrix sp. Canyon 246 TaxID=1827136 RepID=UPI00084A0D62|nr:hypothetical protein [Candidatus Marithrix sp. Canyon 246]
MVIKKLLLATVGNFRTFNAASFAWWVSLSRSTHPTFELEVGWVECKRNPPFELEVGWVECKRNPPFEL